MVRLFIEVDDHPSWAEATKEAVAERLDGDLNEQHTVGFPIHKCQKEVD